MLGRPKFVLASGSPRRLALLNQAGIEPDALRPADVDETPRRGELPDFVVDGRAVELQSRAPLARLQARQDVQNVLLWLDTITRLGPEASGVLNLGEAARWLATMLGVPDELVADSSPLASLAAALSGRGGARAGS